jgi:hypothetical protein
MTRSGRIWLQYRVCSDLPSRIWLGSVTTFPIVLVTSWSRAAFGSLILVGEKRIERRPRSVKRVGQ